MTLSGIVILVKLLQLENAPVPILVTLPRIVTLVKDAQPSNAELSIFPIVITTFFSPLFVKNEQAHAGILAVSYRVGKT